MIERVVVMLHMLALQVRGKASEKLQEEDRGQTSLEYLGIAVFVVAVIIALLNTKLGDSIGSALSGFVDTLKGKAGS